MGRIIWLFTLTYFYVVRSGPITGTAFFCRDPDTGKLHSVNSTWQSISFCGNYTCKLRQKNTTTEFKPYRQINITNLRSNDNADSATNINPTINTIMNEKEKELNDAKERLTTVLHQQKAKSSEAPDPNLVDIMKTSENGDRLLTESEIKTISKILHTVKKSDLDAIVEIYNLAQDIYKEMDTTSTPNLEQALFETDSQGKPKFKHENIELADNNHVSYWYEPLNNAKGKAIDMTIAGSNLVNTVAKPTTEPAYFKGVLTNSDFRKLPYYYPISSFQRMSSYVHGIPNYNHPEVKTPCKTKMNVKGPAHNGVIKRPFAVETQKAIQPSILLPYPFSYVHHYNITNSPYMQNVWGQYVIPKNNRNTESNYFQVANNAVVNGNLNERDQKQIVKDDIKRKAAKPEWQTNQLETDILEEVRANIDDKKLIKSFPFRKKVSLEKVGKVIKLDEVTRTRRDVKEEKEMEITEKVDSLEESVESERFEVYLEKTTCHSDTQPGFFRVGNMSQPYPKCCPQRIK